MLYFLMLFLVQIWTQEALELPTLTAYVSYAQKHIHPKLLDEAAEDLISAYVAMQRKEKFLGSNKKVRLGYVSCPFCGTTSILDKGLKLY